MKTGQMGQNCGERGRPMKLSIYDEIRKDHLEIESLFRKIFALEVDEHSQHFLRHRLVADLRKCWVSHARAEEAVLYNIIGCAGWIS